MGSLVYRSKDGDTVDYICWKVYGKTSGVVEQVLDANPGLAALGPILPTGTEVTLPDIQAPTASNTLGLWQA